MQSLFELGFATHEDGLHLLGGFEFKIFAEVAVGSRERDFLAVLRNFLLHELFVFCSALFQTAPGDNQRRRLFYRLRARDHALQFRIKFDHPREQRTLRQLIEQWTELKPPQRITGNGDVTTGKDIAE